MKGILYSQYAGMYHTKSVQDAFVVITLVMNMFCRLYKRGNYNFTRRVIHVTNCTCNQLYHHLHELIVDKLVYL